MGEVGEQPRQIPEGVKAEAAGSADPDDNQVNMMLTLIIPHLSEIAVVLLEVFEAHLVLVDLRVFEAVLNLVQCDLSPHSFEHGHDVLRYQKAFPEWGSEYLSLSRW